MQAYILLIFPHTFSLSDRYDWLTVNPFSLQGSSGVLCCLCAYSETALHFSTTKTEHDGQPQMKSDSDKCLLYVVNYLLVNVTHTLFNMYILLQN